MAYDFNSLIKQADEASNRDKFYTDFKDVDPNVLHQISELTDWMRTKAKGSDVREVIAQLFERTWLEESKKGNANMEVAKARGRFPVLNERLNNADKERAENTRKLAQKANKDEVTNVITPKGTLAYASLPKSGNQVGWYYYCPDGDGTHGAGNYVWNGKSWFFGGTGDEGYNLLKEGCNLLRKDLDKIEEDVYSSSNTPISIYESVSGWKLNESDGLSSSDNAYKLVKFNITAGKVYNISGSERFQFQSEKFVPQSGTSNRIGITYQSDGYAIAPIGAKYLIISALSESNVTVKVAESLPKKINSYVSKNLCGLDPNILYPVNINVGDVLTFSTENGVLYPNDSLDVLFFDSNKQYIGAYSLLQNTNVRTIETVIGAKYITFNHKPYVPVQVEFGNHSDYMEYVFNSNYVKSIVDNGYYNLYPLTNGSWLGNNLTTDINIKLRLSDFVKVKAGDIIEIDNGSFVYAVGLWDSNMNRYRSDSIWNDKSERLEIEKDGYLMIVFKKSSDEIIGINDFDGSIKFYIRDISESIIDGNDEMYIDNKKISIYNPYKNKRTNKYKGQLHCHTTNSDGKWSVDKTMSKYSEAGYDFITITDHNFITEEPTDLHGMVWIGNSLEDTNNVPGKQHCNIIGAKSVVNKIDAYSNTNTVQSMVIDYVKKQNAILQYNHPDDVTVYVSNEDLDNMPDGISLIEIYNGSDGHSLTTIETTSELPYSGCQFNANYYCEADGKTYVNRNSDADSMVNVWDCNIIRPVVDTERGFTHLLDAGHKVFGTATDDCHFISTFNYGWVQVFTDRRNKTAIMNGLLSGNFYASCGVELSSVFVEDGVYEINIEDGENAVTTFYGYGLEVLKTCNGSKANYEFNGNEKYVRAVVEIGDKKAWTQPVWLLNSKYNYEF